MDAAPKKYNTVYKITNNANKKKKIYIGVHATNDLNDNYLGSGTALDHAKKKHGKENFTKEILSTHDTYEQALEEEARIVTKAFVKRKDNYNMQTGGVGGIPSDETKAKMSAANIGRPVSAETRAKISAANKGKPKSAEHRANMSASKIGKPGMPHSDEAKAKMSATMKGHTTSAETRAKISASKTGSTHSDESKAKMVAAAKNRPKKTCPHCGVIMVQFHYTRYHGNNCKMKPDPSSSPI